MGLLRSIVLESHDSSFIRLNWFNDEVSQLSPCLDPVPFAPLQPSSF